jgi:hypothetical protein
MNRFFQTLRDKVLPRSEPEEVKYTRLVQVDGHVITYDVSYLYSPMDGEKHLVELVIAVDDQEAGCFFGQIAAAVLDLMETEEPIRQPDVIYFLTAYETVNQFLDKHGWHMTVRQIKETLRRERYSVRL